MISNTERPFQAFSRDIKPDDALLFANVFLNTVVYTSDVAFNHILLRLPHQNACDVPNYNKLTFTSPPQISEYL